MNTVKFLKYFCVVLYFAALTVSAVLLFVFGISTIATTFFAYTLLTILSVATVNFFANHIQLNNVTNFKILLISVYFSLFIGEVILRFVFKKNLTFNERSGNPYISDYKKIQKQNFRLNRILSHNVNWTKTNVPNSSRILTRDNFSYKHSYNSQGLRDTEFEWNSNDSTKIVLGLGDSFTEGVGTHQDSTWLKFFERKWNKDHPEYIVKTYNAGISGSDVFFEYLLLKEMLDFIYPELVMVSLNTTDIDECIIRGGMDRFKPQGRVVYNPPPWWESIYAVSFISRVIINSLVDLDWTLHTASEKKQKDFQALDSISSCIQSFSKLAQQHNFRLVVVLSPVEKEIKTGRFLLSKVASAIGNDSSITVINLFDEYRKRDLINLHNSSNFYWPVDLHHKPRGYQVWGEVVSDILTERKINL